MSLYGLPLCGVLVLVASMAACSRKPASSRQDAGPCGATDSSVVCVEGAGTQSASPLCSRWAAEYGKQTPKVRISYQRAEAEAAIRQLEEGTIDFVARDAPIPSGPTAKAAATLQQLPLTMGAVAVIYHEAGIGRGLKLSPTALAGIVLGRAAAWNDPAMAEANPDATLPAAKIVLARADDHALVDGVVAEYLGRFAPEWKEQLSERTAQPHLAGRHSVDDASTVREVQATAGSLALVALTHASLDGVAVASVQNRNGRYVEPTFRAIAAAVKGVDLPDSLAVSLVDGASPEAYPMSFFTYVLVPRDAEDAVQGEALLRFLWWASHDGQLVAEPPNPLPARVVAALEGRLKQLKAGGRQVLAGP